MPTTAIPDTPDTVATIESYLSIPSYIRDQRLDQHNTETVENREKIIFMHHSILIILYMITL